MLVTVAVIASFSFLHESYAASIVWDGSESALWSTGDNWVGGVAPGSSDIAVFNSSANIASNIDGAHGGSVAGIPIDHR